MSGARSLRFDRSHFCGAKAPLFLHEMQKTKENAIGTEAAQPPEYPAYPPAPSPHGAPARSKMYNIAI